MSRKRMVVYEGTGRVLVEVQVLLDGVWTWFTFELRPEDARKHGQALLDAAYLSKRAA